MRKTCVIYFLKFCNIRTIEDRYSYLHKSKIVKIVVHIAASMRARFFAHFFLMF